MTEAAALRATTGQFSGEGAEPTTSLTTHASPLVLLFSPSLERISFDTPTQRDHGAESFGNPRDTPTGKIFSQTLHDIDAHIT